MEQNFAAVDSTKDAPDTDHLKLTSVWDIALKQNTSSIKDQSNSKRGWQIPSAIP